MTPARSRTRRNSNQSSPKSPLRRPFVWIALACVGLSLPLAGVLTPMVGNSPVDISLILAEEPDRTPAVFWGELSEFQKSMGRFPAEYAPKWGFVELVALGKKPSHAKKQVDKTEVWVLKFPYMDRLMESMYPPGSWEWKREALVSYRHQPSMVRWEGFDVRSPRIVLRRHDWSGMAEIRTIEGAVELDLYSARRKRRGIRIPMRPAVGYQAQVPRRALRNLRIDLAGMRDTRIYRLHVGTVVPRVFYTGDQTLKPEVALVTRHWEPYRGGNLVELPPISPWEWGGVWTFLVLTALFFLFLFALALMGWAALWLFAWLRSPELPAWEYGRCSPAWSVICFAVPAAIWLFYLACFFPAAMSLDSVDQWDQAMTMELTDAHPALHTLTIRLLTRLWHSPAAVALAQILLMAFAVSFGLSTLRRGGLKWPILVAALIWTALSPRNGYMTVVLWKDVFYGLLMYLLTALLLRQVLKERARDGWISWAALALCLALLPLYRHNGLIVLVGVGALLPFFFWGRRWRAAIAVAAALCVFVGAKTAMFRALDVKRETHFHEHLMYSAFISSVLTYRLPLENSELELIDKIRDLDRWPPYNPVIPGAPWIPDYRYEVASENVEPYRELFFSLVARYPAMFALHMARCHSFLYLPVNLEPQAINTHHDGIFMNEYNLEERPLFRHTARRLKHALREAKKPWLTWLVWRPALALYLVLAAALVALWRLRDPRLLIAYAPVLVNTVGLLLFAYSQHQRFQFPLTFSTSLLMAVAFLPRPGAARSEDGARPNRRSGSNDRR